MNYKLSEFQGGNGNWHVICSQKVGSIYNNWLYITRKLNKSPKDFILMLLNDYHATIDGYKEYDNGWLPYLAYHFKNYEDAHKFVLMINKQKWVI